MNLQNIFYILGIIYMVFGIIILCVIAVGLFIIKKKIDDVHKTVMEKIEQFSRPAEIAMGVGSAVAATALGKFKSILGKRGK